MIRHLLKQRTVSATLVVWAGVALSACESRPVAQPAVTPVYSRESGKLEQLVSDKDGDGKAETRAFMDGASLRRIEIDRNGDGVVDRWEFYAGGPSPARGVPVPAPVIERAEESNAPDRRVTRREFYNRGVIERVEEDTDADGRVDKWEWYQAGDLARVELDLAGKGVPTQRLVYGAGGAVVRVETDPEGKGKFVVVPPRS